MSTTEVRRIRIGHSPDPDDAFMYYPLGEGKVDTEGLCFTQVLEDIESLNRRAMRGELETTAASVHAMAYLADRYAILPCGASMGEGYGPIVVAKEALAVGALSSSLIAVPGLMTSAWLALRLAIGPFRHVVVPFDQIQDAVTEGSADAGLLIHEGQITWAAQGFHRVLDLGEWWNERTGLPLPLGVNIVRTDLPEEDQRAIGRSLRRAIAWSLAHRGEALDYAGRFGRGLAAPLTDRFVGMYVNDLTLDAGERGREAIRLFLKEGRACGAIEGLGIEPAFVSLEA